MRWLRVRACWLVSANRELSKESFTEEQRTSVMLRLRSGIVGSVTYLRGHQRRHYRREQSLTSCSWNMSTSTSRMELQTMCSAWDNRRASPYLLLGGCQGCRQEYRSGVRWTRRLASASAYGESCILGLLTPVPSINEGAMPGTCEPAANRIFYSSITYWMKSWSKNTPNPSLHRLASRKDTALGLARNSSRECHRSSDIFSRNPSCRLRASYLSCRPNLK